MKYAVWMGAVVSILALLTGCGKVADVIPLSTNIQAEELQDGTYHVAFQADDCLRKKDNLYLNIELYDYDRYEAEDVLKMKNGDIIESLGEMLAIDSIEQVKQGEDVVCVEFNGGHREGGLTLWKDSQEGTDCYYSYTPSGHPLYYPVGEQKLKLSRNLCFIDSMEDPSEQSVGTDLEGFEEFLKQGENTEFACLSTEITVREGEIEVIRRHWIP